MSHTDSAHLSLRRRGFAPFALGPWLWSGLLAAILLVAIPLAGPLDAAPAPTARAACPVQESDRQNGDEAVSTPSAQEILKEAAKVQGWPKELAEEKPALRLSVEMGLQVKNKKGTQVFLLAKRQYLDPYYLFSQIEDRASGTTTRKGFDGDRGWFVKDGDPRVTYLDGANYEEDRKSLQRDMEETRLLAQVFFLRHLAEEMKDPKRLADDQGHGKKSYVIKGEGKYRSEGTDRSVQLSLWIEKETYTLLGARVEDGKDSIQLCFWAHKRNPEGIQVPKEIKIFRNDSKDPTEIIYLTNILFRPDLATKDFKAR